METKRSSPPSSNKIKKSLFVFVISLLSFLAIFLLDLKTRIKLLEIKNIKGNQKIIGLTDYKNKSLLLINDETLARELKNKNPYLKALKAEKKFPSILILYPDFYEPVAVLEASLGFFVLSEDGRILAKTKIKQEDLTSIKYYQKLNYYSYSSGDYLDLMYIKLGLSFSQNLTRLGLPVDILDIADRDMLVCNVGEKKIIFTAAKDFELQKYEVNQIIRQLKIKGQDFRSIDLRFKKPVIKL